MNKSFVPFLPPWVETGLQPAFYDAESGTVLQQTARMYSKVNQLTRHFNEFSENVVNEINAFEQNVDDKIVAFEEEVDDKIEDFEDSVNDTVDEYIEKFNELHDYVYDYFDNLDVQEEINHKLDEMAEDGDLKEIMEPYFSDLENMVKSAYTIDYISVNRFCRTIFDKSLDEYDDLQGGCYVGNGKAIKAMLKADNDVKLIEFNLTTGEVIRSEILALGHCNGLDYDPEAGKLYAAGLKGTYVNNLYVIDYDTLAIEETIVLDVGDDYAVSSPAIDHATGKFYIAAERKASPQDIKLFEMNTETHALTPIAVSDPFNMLGSTSNNQSCAYNGIVYVLKFNPACIIAVDVANHRISSIYNLPISSSEGYWLRDEQYISFIYDGDPGEMLIGTGDDDAYNSGWYITQAFRTNLFSGTPTRNNYNTNVGFSDIYVDITSTSANPTGRQDNPFKTLGEALDFSDRFKGCTYYLIGDTNTVYPMFRVYPRHGDVTIRSYNSKCKIDGFRAFLKNKLKLIDVTITSGTPHNIQSETQGQLILANVTIPNAENNLLLRNIALTVYNVPNDAVYNIEFTGDSNTFARTSSGNMSKVHLGGTGNLTLINTKALGSVTATNTSTSDNGIDVSADANRLSGSYTLRYMAYYNYSRTFGNINIPNAGGNSIFSFTVSNYLVRCQLYRTNDNIIYIVVSKAFAIENDGTLTDITSSITGSISLSIDNSLV